HNDLEEVGHDTYHHTMFEMLGNWSFGDYFKKEAIEWAWEYLVTVLGLDPDRLYATVFEGSPSENLGRDDEAASYWAQFLPAERIINGNKHDNFWEMGDTGPCGPCSEIHIDLRPDEERARVNGLELINKNHPQVIEIWNLVFMQYNRRADSSLDALPHKVIDTGMGFERLCMAIQGKTSNYDTDVFQPLISTLATMSGIRYGDDASTDIAMRVVADHIRTIAFAITDGQLPSNAKAGYVIRRILRRAVRYGYTFLHCREAFMYRLLPTLIDTMGDAYPELQAQRELIGRVIKEEEESFLRTLETGIRLLDKKIAESKATGSTTLRGTDAFELYDTFGFPLDLTALILAENGMTVDEAGFDTEMQKQKERARNAAAMEAGDWVVIREGESKFSGYDFTETETEILRYRLVKQKNKEYYQVVLSDTPFYAEMGGQVGDSGQLIDESGVAYDIFDTKRENNLPVHLMKKLPESTTDTFVARIHEEKRRQAEANHTATHLMHEALRDVLGTHVEQKGSFVSPEVLRFDFSHFGKMSVEEIRKVEELVAQRIRADYRREEFRDVPIAEAQAMGAMALFGEKYGEEVRVMKYGSSVELCGGTHIPSTGMIGTFRIVSESSIASGIRRIEAVTGANAERLTYEREDILLAIKELFNNNPNLIKSIEKMLEEDIQLKKQVADMKQERIARFKKTLLEQDIRRRGIRVFAIKELMQTEMMKDLAFQIAGEMTESFAIVAGTIESENKCALTVMLSKDLVESGMDAAKLVRNAAGLIQGGGGGQPHFATAGGKKSEGIHAAVEQILKEADLAN
uniref:alanine--tRNA ligase n=1 Tax=Porphyromonas loveana TaxID=1884669 RepID=UPI0035A16D8E